MSWYFRNVERAQCIFEEWLPEELLYCNHRQWHHSASELRREHLGMNTTRKTRQNHQHRPCKAFFFGSTRRARSVNNTLWKEGSHSHPRAQACATPCKGSLLWHHFQGTQWDAPSKAHGKNQEYAAAKWLALTADWFSLTAYQSHKKGQ